MTEGENKKLCVREKIRDKREERKVVASELRII